MVSALQISSYYQLGQLCYMAPHPNLILWFQVFKRERTLGLHPKHMLCSDRSLSPLIVLFALWMQWCPHSNTVMKETKRKHMCQDSGSLTGKRVEGSSLVVMLELHLDKPQGSRVEKRRGEKSNRIHLQWENYHKTKEREKGCRWSIYTTEYWSSHHHMYHTHCVLEAFCSPLM